LKHNLIGQPETTSDTKKKEKNGVSKKRRLTFQAYFWTAAIATILRPLLGLSEARNPK
jgi:hypothetical protein